MKKSITDDDIERAIKVYNHTRRLLKSLWEFLRFDHPPITGRAVATVTLASQVMDKQECNQMLEQLVRRLEAEAGARVGDIQTAEAITRLASDIGISRVMMVVNKVTPADVSFCDGLKEKFHVQEPKGAFYIFPEVPGSDGEAFVEKAIKNNLFIVPGSVFSKRKSQREDLFCGIGGNAHEGN